MSTHAVYSSKAELYARYRWDYAPQAIQALCERVGVSSATRIADVGAGTGILTRHFLGRAGKVVAIEPNPEMRSIARRDLPGADCLMLAGAAEALPLASASADLIVVGQALHWFEAGPARDEFRRALRPGGWLAVVRNYPDQPAVGQAIAAFHTPAYGVAQENGAPALHTPIEFYYGHPVERGLFSFQYRQTWEAFFGALRSASYTPEPQHPAFGRYEAAARAVFERFAVNGILEARAVTELYVDQLACG